MEREAGAEYLVIRFRPGQAPRLADVRSSELTNGFVELTHLGGLPIPSVAERLRLLPDLASRQRALAELMRDVAPPLVEDARCRRATLLLEAHGGQLRVEALAEELGLNVRGLERRFLEHFGMTPKRMSRLVRLRHVLGALHSGAFASLAELALACGYSDQPHLIRDFKALTDRLPTGSTGPSTPPPSPTCWTTSPSRRARARSGQQLPWDASSPSRRSTPSSTCDLGESRRQAGFLLPLDPHVT